MRSHAKASTAGSNQRQAGRLGRIFRGADATRGASLASKGGSAPKARGLTFPLALLVAVLSLALGAASALAVAPTITSTSASAVTTKAALLEAEINPEGEATTYHFEYGLADCASSACTSIPVPNGNVGSGSSAVKVTKEIAGLSPGTTYHFRVLATNGSGTTPGPDKSFTTYATVAPDTGCPNQAFRVGPGANLPDCRGYEMVSPIDKNGSDIFTTFNNRNSFNQSSVNGDKITYSADAIFGDQPSGRNASQYIATRGPSGWASHGINAPRGKKLTPSEEFVNYFGDLWGQFHLFSDDLSEALVNDDNRQPLTPDASPGWINLYRRDNLDDSYEALTRTTLSPPSVQEHFRFPEVAAASSDAKHVVFTVSAAMTPDAAPGEEFQTYYYSGGEMHLVSVLPDGSAHSRSSGPGFLVGHFNGGGVSGDKFGGLVSHAISDDGSRIFWTASPGFEGPGAIYVRENPGQPQSALNGSNECTEPAKACTRPVATGVGIANYFWAASADGSKVLYTSGLEKSGALKEFDVDAETTTPIAGEVGGVAGASDDLSYFYFTSKEALDAGATAGEWNLYVDHEGAIGFIATISPLDAFSSDSDSYSSGTGGINDVTALNHAARVTPDGRHLAFMSDRSLTGYDNTDAISGEADREVYLYDAAEGELICASCNPSGAQPVGHKMYRSYTRAIPAYETEVWAAAWLQTWVHSVYQSHALSDDGNRLYFNSYDALVPNDTNGVQDVYQWEAQGSGSCQRAGGCVSLISTGEDAKRSEFVDATPNGSDVFIETSSSIDTRDPGLIDIYDARVNGGFSIPPNPEGCVGDACQSVPEAPRDPTPASASFKGAGNPAPRKALARCKARKRHASKGKHHAKHSKAKRCTRANRRAGR